MAGLNFKGKVVLVTGATRGLGYAMAIAFRKAGASRVICTGTAAHGKLPKGLEYWPLDLSSSSSIAIFIGRLQALKGLDVLVNNAGINKIEPIDQLNIDDWNKIIQVNLTGAMIVMKEAAKLMKKKRIHGRILNISSIYGLISRAQRNSYSASKAGLIGLTHASALDLAPHGILVNALCPGFVLTDLTKSILSKADIANIKGQIPMGRFGTEEDIANTALFLCSDLNTYITGQTLVADGGVSIQ
jgi:3-oxoacyl-[acyl-carrier protein] reductase